MSQTAFRISPQQRHIYDQQLLSPGFNGSCKLEIAGVLSGDAVHDALSRIVANHGIFRTTYCKAADIIYPLQTVTDDCSFSFEFVDLMDSPPGLREQQINEATGSYDDGWAATKQGVLHAKLFRLKEASFILYYSIPGMAADSITIRNIAVELSSLLANGSQRAESISYVQFSEWQNNVLDTPDPDAITFWQNYHDPNFKYPILSYAEPENKSVQSFLVLRHDAGQQMSLGIFDFSARHGLDVESILMACWNIILFRRNATGFIETGLVSHGRSFEELTDIAGVVSRTLPIRCHIDGGLPFLDLAKELARIIDDVKGWQDYFIHPGDVQKDDLPVGFEYLDLDDRLLFANEHIRVSFNDFLSRSDLFKIELKCYNFKSGIQFALCYNPQIYSDKLIRSILNQFNTLLENILNDPLQHVGKIPMLSDFERHTILNVFNTKPAGSVPSRTYHSVFEEKVTQFGPSTALVFNESSMSYAELNVQANKLAAFLKKFHSIGKEDFVGLLMEPSLLTVVSILGVIKSGAAFVPVDMKYPQERIRFILEDAKVKVVITNDSQTAKNYNLDGFNSVVLNEEAAIVDSCSSDNLEEDASAETLMYAIYTSGTTGGPKGVEIQHDTLLNYVFWANEYYFKGKAGFVFPLFTSLSFDLTLTCIFTTLLRGDVLHIFGNDDIDTLLYNVLCKTPEINTIKLTPSHIDLIRHLDIKTTKINTLIVGGEALTAEQVKLLRQLNGAIDIFNEYGPTEATIGCTVKRITRAKEVKIIGKPISNVSIFILDGELEPVPMGITGEVYIGGHCLARGYLNRVSLTSEKFIQNHFDSGTRLYKTGDLARWLPDGEVEFLGRVDYQIKIRGYRVELREIEDQLAKHPSIENVVVLDRKGPIDDKELVAYYLANKAIAPNELRSFLGVYLPAFMIPVTWIRMETFPLTPNGKIDRDALSKVNVVNEVAGYVAPCTPLDKLIVSLCEKVLGREQISLSDNFYLIGGDSIRGIQIASRLYDKGYKLSLKNIFKNPVIGNWSGLLEEIKEHADQGPVVGVVPLTPIQKDFFSDSETDAHKFTQAIMLFNKSGFEEDIVRRVFTKITEHHDALRSTFKKQHGEVVQHIQDLRNPFSLEICDLKGKGDQMELLADRSKELQESISLANGPLMKLLLFRLDDGDKLLIVVHHLVIDTVSWRILIQDIDLLFSKIGRNEPTDLPPKTASYKTWAEGLEMFAKNKDLTEEREYWNKILDEKVNLQTDYPYDGNFERDVVAESFNLNEEYTDFLLTKAHRAFKTDVNDVLLTSLGLALKDAMKRDKTLIALERHGREESLNIDCSRTVGWFTSIFLFLLTVEGDGDWRQSLVRTKEELRNIPNNGIGYALLNHDRNGEAKAVFDARPDICFNYLGQFDSDLHCSSFEVLSEFAENRHGKDRKDRIS